MAETDHPPPLLRLPSELIQAILIYLPPTSLALLSTTCKLLREHATSEQLWQPLVNENLPEPLKSPKPLSTFRELYVAHHPYWFLPRHKIWISDAEPSGKLLVSRYDSSRGCIEAYAVVAERGLHTFELWCHDRNVAIHSFNPKVQLDLNQPVLSLNIGSQRTHISTPPVRRAHSGYLPPARQVQSSTSGDQVQVPALSKEILMDCSAPPGLTTTFFLARDHPAPLTQEGTAVWPPLHIPAPSRTRNSSAGGYASSGHRPSKLSEVSQNTFRLRRWVEFHGRRPSNGTAEQNRGGFDRLSAALGLGFLQSNIPPTVNGGMSIRMGEEVSTFGTLLAEAYTPTPAKPWRGIWCGDYSGHGCEFLALLQPDAGEEGPLPDGMNWMRQWLTTGRRDSESSWSSYMSAYSGIAALANGEMNEENSDDEVDWDMDAVPGELGPQRPIISNGEASNSTDDVYSGRLVAVKLTGDPNIPRGEYTFIAPDLSDKGLVRTATEEIFEGARIVRSAGHIANRGFQDDEYMPSQIILLSHDRLAQYWEGFGHISFYHRVDLDALMKT